jgi:ankyrin repeat protein
MMMTGGGFTAFTTCELPSLLPILGRLFGTTWTPSGCYRTTWGPCTANMSNVGNYFGEHKDLQFSSKSSSMRDVPDFEKCFGAMLKSRHESLAMLVLEQPNPRSGLEDGDYDVCIAVHSFGRGCISVFGDINFEPTTALLVSGFCLRETAVEAEVFAMAREEKERGNAKFLSGDTACALEHYRAAEIMFGEVIGTATQREEKVKILSNSSQCLLALGLHAEAAAKASQALALDGRHVKSLLRRAKSLCEIGDCASLDIALSDVERARRLEPSADSSGSRRLRDLILKKVAGCKPGSGITTTECLPRTVDGGPSTGVQAPGKSGSMKDLDYELLTAAATGRHALVKTLLAAGACADVRCEEGFTALLWTCMNGHAEAAQALLQCGPPGLLRQAYEDGTNGLMYACHLGYLDVVKVLTRVGGMALMLTTRPDGRSCLHCAAEGGHLAVVRHLVAEGRDELLGRTIHGASALHVASGNGHLDVVRFLVEQFGRALLFKSAAGETGSCLTIAAMTGHCAVVEYLAAVGGLPLILQPSEKGETCLHAACRIGQLETARLIVKAGGVDLIRLAERDGTTCLHTACASGRLEIVKFLVQVCAPYPAHTRGVWLRLCCLICVPHGLLQHAFYQISPKRTFGSCS